MTKEETLLAAFKECGLPIEENSYLSGAGVRYYNLLGGAAYVAFTETDGEVREYHGAYE